MMRFAISVFVLAAALTIPAAAQDNTVTSRTAIKADDARLVSMTGCVREDPVTHAYMLVGAMAVAGDELKSKTKTNTDVDRDDTKVKTTTKTKVDNGAVATTGSITTYALLSPAEVPLSNYVGRRVELSAIMADPGHGDADVKIKEKTKVDPEHGDDSTIRSKTKSEVPRTPFGQYTVVSVKPVAGTCSTN
jgi:hypothetical protein